MTRTSALFLSLFAASGVAHAQEQPEANATAAGDDAAIAEAIERYFDDVEAVRASYGKKGFRLESRDGNFQTNLQWRAQLRATTPYRSDPRSLGAFDSEQTTFEGRRLRMKIGGHGYRPWLKYYFEVDLQPTRSLDSDSERASARVIDWRIDVAKQKEFGIRVGQWKIDYNRERVDSSGRQQFVERSIINRTFTIDRQMGISFRGRLFEGTAADIRYYAGVFTGEGRGVSNDDNNLMYAGRLQWNFLGRDLALRQTDVERTEKPTGTFALGAASHTGRATRWSSSGGGNLDGFERVSNAVDGQYRINQAVAEFAYKHQGFSTQNELHWKQIEDTTLDLGASGRRSELYGYYTQFGYFFNEIYPSFPEELELAVRYAWLEEPNGNDISLDNEREEATVAANWFFNGHNNKLTLDYSYLTLDDGQLGVDEHGHRVRLQWDISF